MQRVLSLVAILLASSMALGADATFAVPPKATKDLAVRDGDQVKIEFAVSQPTDVTVDVIDAQGKVVRHLGAAALGAKNAPPPPFQAGLAQAITWDGKDDAGQTLFPSPSMGEGKGGGEAKTGTGTISEKSIRNGASRNGSVSV